MSEPLWKRIGDVLESGDTSVGAAMAMLDLLRLAYQALKPEQETDGVGDPLTWLPYSGKDPKKRAWRETATGKECALYACDLIPLVNAYDGVYVYGEVLKARTWLLANKDRRKTANGLPRFLNSWMARAQDGPRHVTYGKPAAQMETQGIHRMSEERSEDERNLNRLLDRRWCIAHEFGDHSEEAQAAEQAILDFLGEHPELRS